MEFAGTFQPGEGPQIFILILLIRIFDTSCSDVTTALRFQIALVTMISTNLSWKQTSLGSRLDFSTSSKLLFGMFPSGNTHYSFIHSCKHSAGRVVWSTLHPSDFRDYFIPNGNCCI